MMISTQTEQWTLFHIHNQDAFAIAWPHLKERIIAFPPPEAMPQHLLPYLETALQNGTAHAWLAVTQETEQVVGHAFAWADWYFGHPYILIYHAVLDTPYHVLPEHRSDFLTHLYQWILTLQQTYTALGHPAPTISLRFLSRRPGMLRYIRQHIADRVETMTLFSIPVDPIQDGGT